MPPKSHMIADEYDSRDYNSLPNFGFQRCRVYPSLRMPQMDVDRTFSDGRDILLNGDLIIRYYLQNPYTLSILPEKGKQKREQSDDEVN
jgi:hypothetical protein